MISRIVKIPGKIADSIASNMVVNHYKAENRDIIDSLINKIKLIKDISDTERSHLISKMQKERTAIIDTRNETKLKLQNAELKKIEKEIKNKYKK